MDTEDRSSRSAKKRSVFSTHVSVHQGLGCSLSYEFDWLSTRAETSENSHSLWSLLNPQNAHFAAGHGLSPDLLSCPHIAIGCLQHLVARVMVNSWGVQGFGVRFEGGMFYGKSLGSVFDDAGRAGVGVGL